MWINYDDANQLRKNEFIEIHIIVNLRVYTYSITEFLICGILDLMLYGYTVNNMLLQRYRENLG